MYVYAFPCILTLDSLEEHTCAFLHPFRIGIDAEKSEAAHTCLCMPLQERTNARQRNAGLRLDYVLVTPGLLDRVRSCEIVTDIPPKVRTQAQSAFALHACTRVRLCTYCMCLCRCVCTCTQICQWCKASLAALLPLRLYYARPLPRLKPH